VGRPAKKDARILGKETLEVLESSYVIGLIDFRRVYMPSIIGPGVYITSYGTEARYNGYGEQAWDLKYRQYTDIAYLRQRIRNVRQSDNPSYYADRGRDEIVSRGIKFDPTGRLKVRKI
jgi:hypothetical protein